MVMWKGGSIMNLPELTHEEEVNLERFANLMIELIEKHADAVDKDEMLKKLNSIEVGAQVNKNAFGKIQVNGKIYSFQSITFDAKICKLAHIRMALEKIMQSV